MSSYQFVNSLASSCYGRGTAAAAATAGADLSGMSAADYYATAMSSYQQQNCYPTQQQQHYADYQQHPQQQQHAMPMSPVMSNGAVDFNTMAGMQQQQPMQQARLQQQQQPIQQQQQQQSMRIPSGQQQQRLNSVASPVNLGMLDNLATIPCLSTMSAMYRP